MWRLAPDRVIVRKITDPAGNAADLFGPAALIWVAAEEPISAAQLVADTGTPSAVAAQTITILIDGGWLIETPS